MIVSSRSKVPDAAKIFIHTRRKDTLLPNPAGQDQGNEKVVIGNGTDAAEDLAGWKLRDRANNVFALASTVRPTGRLVVTMAEPTMPLNNDGDDVLLIDAGGVVRNRAAYAGFEARAGVWVESDR